MKTKLFSLIILMFVFSATIIASETYKPPSLKWNTSKTSPAEMQSENIDENEYYKVQEKPVNVREIASEEEEIEESDISRNPSSEEEKPEVEVKPEEKPKFWHFDNY
jgi:hypothetical protein